ncbi:hypothetical protein SIAM614_05466 [Stappia aggregata IAM 12614]|jgi:hypothetical protein|uniref:Uncharacterized protein n=1 Tax=Roseibium aggregatum (strain ATCC 25650 / DSM 13394 / JCM 20685 / NBRC 16684 / NCIMB 2208 / IAM 12614 / B1) TaxID=384765 RepID=A0P3D8_ROSAI|nr:hypothetical protein SIAM614_05466 [Stappia aggregata IAM 12614] [Roseibium aggregatum IAM 12614]
MFPRYPMKLGQLNLARMNMARMNQCRDWPQKALAASTTCGCKTDSPRMRLEKFAQLV